MPELPEVETVRRTLLPHLQGHTIKSVTVKKDKIIAMPDPALFQNIVESAVVKDIRRYGKFLLLDLDNEYTITIHLRMTGQLLVMAADEPLPRHTHLVFGLDDSRELRYADLRAFGRFWLLETAAEDTITGVQKLGLEPFDPRLNGSYLQEKFGRRHVTIKQALLEQSVVAGIGNIYADEILHVTKIRPEKLTCDLKKAQWTRIAKAIPEMLDAAIEHNLSVAEENLRLAGKVYGSQDFRKVYGREGEPCHNCGTVILRKVIGGRSSHYCPKCQRR